MLKLKTLTWVSALLLSAFAGTASASPVGLDGQLFYSGGDLKLKNLPASSSYQNYMYLRTPLGGDRFLFVDNGSQLVTFAQNALAGFGVGIGDELLFLIKPNNGPTTYFTGPTSRNSDKGHHAVVSPLAGNEYRIAFEDLYRGGDSDFNDAALRVITGAHGVSEPAPLALLSLGLLGLGMSRRRKG